MGKRGPKPKSKHILKLRGSWRGDLPENEIRSTAKLPKPPDILKGSALKEWKRVAPILYEAGLLNDVYAISLLLYCEGYSEYLEIKKYVEELRKKKKPETDEMTLNRWIRIKHKVWTDVKKLAAAFGMSPSDSGNVSPLKLPKKKESKAQKWISKNERA